MTSLYDAFRKVAGESADVYNPELTEDEKLLMRLKRSSGVSLSSLISMFHVNGLFGTHRVGRCSFDYDPYDWCKLGFDMVKGISLAWCDIPKVLNAGVEFDELTMVGIVGGDRLYIPAEKFDEIRSMISPDLYSFAYLNDSKDGIVHLMVREAF